MPSRALASMGATGLALGACRLVAEAFVPAAPTPPAARVLYGATASGSEAPAGSATVAAAFMGAAGLAAAAAAAPAARGRGQVARRAEPASAAVAAAAAAKAAAGAGAAKTAGAVAGSAGAGSLAKGVSEKGSQSPSGGGSSGFDPRAQVGVTDPLGYFDPAGFCTNEETFRNLRAAEIKHGRVSMMAALGAVAQHYIKFPGFEAVPAGLAAAVTPPGSYGFIALFAVAGALELGVWTESADKEPGNFGDPLNLGQYDVDMRNRELNNGRAAMFASIGIIAAELLTGKDGVAQLGL